MYRLILHPKIEKQLKRIPKAYALRVADAMRALRDEPRPAQAKYLAEEMYRVREGDYRIAYAVFDAEQVVFIGKVARRSEKVYRDVNVLLAAARQSVEKD